MHPKLIVKIDKEFDKEIFLYFIDEKIGDFDFGYERIIKDHPGVSICRGKSEAKRKAIINPYVEKYYKKNITDIENSQVVMQKLWDNVVEDYFLVLESIFGSLDFYTKKEIIAFLSIAKCGVIGDDCSNFQIWYATIKEPEEVRRHFAHEILHFYYYTYVAQKGFKNLKNNWDLAEIFNVVILGLPEFVKIIGKVDEGYKQHDKYFPYYKKLWKESDELDTFLKKMNKSTHMLSQ